MSFLEEKVFISSIKQDIVFRIGKNAKQNFDLIDDSCPHDLWFHVEGRPSCHVVAMMPVDTKSWNKKQMRSVVVQGAVICKKHSKYKSESDVLIVYTLVRHVKKTSVLGSVWVESEKQICI